MVITGTAFAQAGMASESHNNQKFEAPVDVSEALGKLH
jgi:hypothetical protein